MASMRLEMFFLVALAPMSLLALEEDDALRLVLLQSQASIIDVAERPPALTELPLRTAPSYGAPQRELRKIENQTERFASVLPLAWFHVPQAGGSFGETLMSMPGVGPTNFKQWNIHKGFGPEDSQELADDGALVTPVIHDTAYTYTGIYRGHTVGFFRQPKQRVITDYYNKFRAYPFSENQPPTLDEYAANTTGCMVKNLVRDKDVLMACGNSTAPSERETALAITRLREAFVFVGITEKWQASVCTFRAMFGGPTTCDVSDFSSTATGSEGSTTDTDHNATMAGLGEWMDPYDGKLYVEAQKVFEAQLRLYKVTPESCAQCMKEAQVEYLPEEWPSM